MALHPETETGLADQEPNDNSTVRVGVDVPVPQAPQQTEEEDDGSDDDAGGGEDSGESN